MATVGAGEMAAPALALLGCTVKLSDCAAAAEMVKRTLLAVRRPGEVALSVQFPARVTERLLKVATPPTAATEVVPPSVAGAEIVKVTVLVAEPTSTPPESRMETRTAAMIAPAVVAAGWVLKESCDGTPL